MAPQSPPSGALDTATAAALQCVREDRLLIDDVDAWLFEEFAPYLGRRVLEVGCGLGNLARLLTDRELYCGVDNSVESIATLAREWGGHPNLRWLVADVTRCEFLSLQAVGFDTALSLNVLEHVEDQDTAIANLHRVLGPGARLILVVPAHRWLYGSMDRSIGHCRRYSRDDMRSLLTRHGFRVGKMSYLNALGALGWLVNGRVLQRRTPPAGQLRVFNRLVPALKAVERLLPPPFGISLLAIAERRDGSAS